MSLSEFMLTLYYYLRQVFDFFWEKIFLSLFIGLIGLTIDVYTAQAITIQALLGLMILDFLLGFYRAIIHKEVCSWKMRFGLGKFVIYGFIVFTGYLTDLLFFKTSINRGTQYFMVLYLGITESISVLEHIAEERKIKIPLLKMLKKKKRQLEDVKNLKDIYDLITKGK